MSKFCKSEKIRRIHYLAVFLAADSFFLDTAFHHSELSWGVVTAAAFAAEVDFRGSLSPSVRL